MKSAGERKKIHHERLAVEFKEWAQTLQGKQDRLLDVERSARDEVRKCGDNIRGCTRRLDSNSAQLAVKKKCFSEEEEKHNTLQDKIRQKERDTKRLNTDADELRQVLDHAKGEFAEATRAKDDAAEAYSQAKGVFEDASKKHADADSQLQALRLRMDNADRTWAVHADPDAQANVAETKVRAQY